MEDELLKELDSILEPAISRSWESAKRMSLGGDPSHAFLDMFKVQIDNTKVELSNSLRKIDIAMQPREMDFVDTIMPAPGPDFPSDVTELPEIDSYEYLKETTDGFEVWDGMNWVKVSKQANIKVEVFHNQENNNRPAVRIWAQDEATKTSILFVDYDIEAPGWDLAMTRVGDYDETMDSFSNNGGYWESPGYNIAKNSLGIGGTVAGALELRQVGNLTPWNTGDAFKNAKGWYRNKEGLYERLSKQRGRGGGGYQKSAQRAAGKAGKWFKIGRKLFWVGAVVSVYDGGDALYRNDSNKAEVVTKATVDIVIGAIGVWGGPIGWAIAGTYFILDVSGAFGDWGQPSGLSTEENRLRLQQNFNNRYGSFIKRAEIDFEMECVPSLEDSKQYYLEEREVKIDNLKVNRRKIIFDKM